MIGEVFATNVGRERWDGEGQTLGDCLTQTVDGVADTGLRWGELTGLRVADINLPALRLRVRRCITQVGGKPILGTPKSRAGIRTVPIPARIAPLLAKRIEDKAPDSPAIASPRGTLLSRENWVHAVR
jgi:integrase